jgi:hypothetical protein
VQLFQDALLEMDPSALPGRIAQAHAAIQERLQQLSNQSAHHEEHQALTDALNALRVLEHEIE